MQRGTAILTLKGVTAGVLVGLLAWLGLPGSSGHAAIGSASSSASELLGRSVGTPSEESAVIPETSIPNALPFFSPTEQAIADSIESKNAESLADAPTAIDNQAIELGSGPPVDNRTTLGNSSGGNTDTSSSAGAVATTAASSTAASSSTTASTVASTPSPVARSTAPATPTNTTEQEPIAATSRTAAARSSTPAPPIGNNPVYVSATGNDSNTGASNSPVASLDRALQIAGAGQSIVFQAGQYGALRLIDIHGTANNPIRIVGAAGAEFRSGSYSREAGILVRDSTNIEIVGVTIRHALWGVYIEGSHGISLLNSDIRDIGQEIVRVKGGSSNVLIEGNVIADSGRRTDTGHANGEGVYIGTGTPSNVDRVSNVTVRNNTISGLTDEAIDIKIPSTNVTIEGNVISNIHTQTSGAIVVHLNNRSSADPNITIDSNIVRNVTRSSPYNDGNCILTMATARITNNILHNCQHRGIFAEGSTGTAFIFHNTLINSGSVGDIVDAGKGMTVVNRNNLGASGSLNRQAQASDFVSPNNGDYRVNSNRYSDAPAVGVDRDFNGTARGREGNTFGAIER